MKRILILLLLLPSIIYCSEFQYSYRGPVAAAMGEACIARPDDADAVFYNPSWLSQVKKPKISGVLDLGNLASPALTGAGFYTIGQVELAAGFGMTNFGVLIGITSNNFIWDRDYGAAEDLDVESVAEGYLILGFGVNIVKDVFLWGMNFKYGHESNPFFHMVSQDVLHMFAMDSAFTLRIGDFLNIALVWRDIIKGHFIGYGTWHDEFGVQQEVSEIYVEFLPVCDLGVAYYASDRVLLTMDLKNIGLYSPYRLSHYPDLRTGLYYANISFHTGMEYEIIEKTFFLRTGFYAKNEIEVYAESPLIVSRVGVSLGVEFMQEETNVQRIYVVYDFRETYSGFPAIQYCASLAHIF